MGECTLRVAIEEANANDNFVGVVDEVRIAIPRPGPHTIAPASALPFITEPLVVDGYTQGDATATTTDVATENTLRTGDNGVVPLTFKPKNKVDPGLFVTATATRGRTGDTSAFSAPRKVAGNR